MDIQNFFETQTHNKKITKGHLKKYMNIKNDSIDWKPFITLVKDLKKSKKNNRYVLLLNDGIISKKVYPVTQLFPLFENKIIKKNDIIKINNYVCTIHKKKIIMLVSDIEKLSTTTNT